MIQTKSQDAYKSCEFLNLLTGKRMGSSCKAFEYLKRQRDSFVVISHKEQKSETSILSCLEKNCKSEASIENTKTDVKIISTTEMNMSLDAIESNISKENSIIKTKQHEKKKTKIDDLNTKGNNQKNTIEVYKPLIVLHLNRFVFDINTSRHVQSAAVSTKPSVNNYTSKRTKNAIQETVEKLPVASAVSLKMIEKSLYEVHLAERIQKYKRNPSFIKAYIEKTKFKSSGANKTRKVTFSQYVEVIEYVKLDYKVPLYDYEYDLK